MVRSKRIMHQIIYRTALILKDSSAATEKVFFSQNSAVKIIERILLIPADLFSVVYEEEIKAAKQLSVLKRLLKELVPKFIPAERISITKTTCNAFMVVIVI